jgi:mannose-6-phosphate isomerase
MNKLYPLRFRPIFKDKIWGGDRIRTRLGLDFSPLPNCGEAWMISGVKGSESRVVNGFLKGNNLNELTEVYMDDLVGGNSFSEESDEFPILIKFIDSNDWLSVQVHPDDAMAARKNIGRGKTEMWYIIDAEDRAELISGFSAKADASLFRRYLEEKRLREILNVERIKKDDVFFIPSGRVHALGPGILLAEIQQTSDTTYRLYDWDRVDNQGKPRELHTELALEAIDYTYHRSYRNEYKALPNETSQLVSCPYFVTNQLILDQTLRKDYSELDSFVIFLFTEGRARIHFEGGEEIMEKGEVLLLPAIMENIVINPLPSCKILEVYVP